MLTKVYLIFIKNITGINVRRMMNWVKVYDMREMIQITQENRYLN